jgi:hypothetical protein
MESVGQAASLGLNVLGTGGNYKGGQPAQANFDPPKDINEATNIIRYINSRRSGTTVIVIDELERLKDEQDKVKLAEFVNSVSSVQTQSKFILSGIGHTVDELLGAHQSATRKLEAIELDPISHSELWKIVSTVADELGVKVDESQLIRSSILSDGFPHYVHLIAESLFWAMFDDEEDCQDANQDHFRAAVKGALERTEVEHKSAYRRATEKVKNTKEYEMALWALADTTETRRQIADIHDKSYLRIARRGADSEDRVMDRAQLNQRLLSLRTEAHGQVVKGYGSGWFSFRETILRGYVRLVAESRGVMLARDLAA